MKKRGSDQREKAEETCTNCGASGHDTKSCTERPRKFGARYTKKKIAADDHNIIKSTVEKDYAAKRDNWDPNRYDYSKYNGKMDLIHQAKNEARQKYLLKNRMKKLDHPKEGEAVVDEDKIDSSNVEQSIRTTRSSGTGNPRDRGDIPKYLLNLAENSAYYDPKSRSMREDPLPDDDPNDKFYSGDNHSRNSGQALEFAQLLDKGIQTAPTQAELLYKSSKVSEDKHRSHKMDKISDKYGNAAAKEETPMALLLGQSEREARYDRAGRIRIGQELKLSESKYEEDVYINNHSSVWGSWWNADHWGYKCCKQTVKHSYCTAECPEKVQDSDLNAPVNKEDLPRREDKD